MWWATGSTSSAAALRGEQSGFRPKTIIREVSSMKKLLLLLLVLALPALSHALMFGRHSFINGPLTSGPEVTKLCRECHEAETRLIMNTVHWNWAKKQPVGGKVMEYGKKNAISSNGCFALPSNWAGCTNCHAGYGWEDGNFDFSKAENVDCLACHETTGSYRKAYGAAGHAAESVDLVNVAGSVDMPNRTACGSCHFYGGGGDGYKHGDLDSSLANPDPEIDVHMGKHNLTCESCHKSSGHDVKGEALSVSPGSGTRSLACTNCHKKDVHRSAALNKHVSRVACQTCHIPFFAKGMPTVLSWDWSTAGKDLKPEQKDGNPEKLYDKMKGDLTLGKNLVPTYLWYNGAVDRVLMGDKIDPSRVVRISAPKGSMKDPDARIFPFKVLKAKQPYDSGNNTLAVVNFYGPPTSDSAYWVTYDWNKAIEAGMKAAGQPYSGRYGWVDTSMAWSLNHMIAPKTKALRCADCHEKGRINWKELGYPKDPRLGKNPDLQ